MPYKPTLFQKLKSYLKPQTLAIKSSEYNERLEVVLYSGKIQLNTRSACYSYEDKYESFGIAFQKIQLQKQNINEVLVLGGGLCSIPQMINQYHKNATFDIVEIDETVIELAKRFAPQKIVQKCNFKKSDALKFMQKNEQKYTLICIDVFIDDLVPQEFINAAFLECIKQSLSNNGLVIMSILPNANGFSADLLAFETQFKAIFKQITTIKAGENLLFTNKV